jgi:hypothetical protein
MRAKHIMSYLRDLLKAREPAYIWGPFGIGKSDMVRAVRNMLSVEFSYDIPLYDVLASLVDAVDFRGCPYIQDGITRWARPSFLPWDNPAPLVLLFLDELANAVPLVQSACLQLILDRRVGEFKLPDNVAIVAASNRVEDRAGSHLLISSLANRFVTHINMEVSSADWQEWALNNGVDASIRAYLAYKPEALHCYDTKLMANATPRSWAAFSRVLPYLTDETLPEVADSSVGKKVAPGYVNFLSIWRDMPDLQDLIANPTSRTKAPVKESPALAHSIATGLADILKADRSNLDLLGRYAAYASRVSSEYCEEYAAVMFRSAAILNPLVATSKCPEGQAWFKSNREVLSAIDSK